MFKYKSPLSRLLEGAGKAKEAETQDAAEPEVAKAEPIADFNALREALAGGNMATDAYEETEELIPEEKMPEFPQSDAAEAASDEDADQDAAPQDTRDDASDIQAPADETPQADTETAGDDQVVTLRLAPSDAAKPDTDDGEDGMLAAVAQAAAPEDTPAAPEDVAEDSPEPAPQVAQVEAAQDQQPAPQEVAPAPAPASDRKSRVKTTFLGFERADTHVQDMIETAEPIAKGETAPETFPVGWLVVTSGPGRGASITLTEGLMQIGRNDDQAIQLDFGDTGISRSNHAVIAYDPEDRKCYLGHGGKANLVRLNGKPVLSTVALSGGDLIRISETTIRFTAFCDDGFDWRDS